MHTCVLVADDRDIYEALDRFVDYYEEFKSDARWDHFGIGGRYEGALPLLEPRTLRRYFGLLPFGKTRNVSVAKKFEINQTEFLVDPPGALFFCDQLYECPALAEGEELSKWQAEFRQRFGEIPDDTTLQIVDAHS